MTKHLIIAFLLSSFSFAFSQNTKQLYQDKYHEFDFWVGEWDVFKYGTDTLVGKSKIESILNGIAIRESYRASRSGYEGTSLNKYNRALDKWEQFWVDNTGMTLHIQGGLIEGQMILKNENNMILWKKDTPDTVRQIWKTTVDKGKSWQIAFDGQYRKRKS